MYFSPPSSDALVNDSRASCRSGSSTNAATNTSAGATYARPTTARRRSRVITPGPSSASRRSPLLVRDLLHLRLRLDDRLVDLAVEHRALDHLDPRRRIAVHHVVEMED